MPGRPKFSITSDDLPKVQELLSQLPSWYTDQAKGVIDYQLAAYKTEMVARSTSGPVFRQTGDLARSWGYKVEGDSLRTLSAFIASFSDTKSYTLEFGGTIFPSGGSRSWIFIPTDRNRQQDGRAIYTPKQVIDAGGHWYTRTVRSERQIYAHIDGKTSPAWNLLVDANWEPEFIQVKHATYVPLLGFFDTGVKHADRMTGKLADFVVDYWKTAS